MIEKAIYVETKLDSDMQVNHFMLEAIFVMLSWDMISKSYILRWAEWRKAVALGPFSSFSLHVRFSSL